MEDKTSPCEGTYKKKTCGSKVFACENCGHRGCQRKGCSERQFLKGEECKDCGAAWQMRYVPPNTRAEAPDRPGRTPGIRLPVDAIFAGIAIAAIALIAAFVSLRHLPDRGAIGGVRLPVIQSASYEPVKFTEADVCACYDEGFELRGKGYDVLSSEYATGFKMCRAVMGVDGGDAWTAGWNARDSARPYEASCRAFKRHRE